jgi:hypothetical protein
MISRSHRVTELHENAIGRLIVGRAVQLQQDLRSGLLETVYEGTSAAQRRKRGLSVERQVLSSIEEEGPRFDPGLRADLIIERKGNGGTEVRGEGRSGSQEAGPHLPSPNRNETWLLAQLRRSFNKEWHHAHRLRRVMSPSPWLRENKEEERTRRCTGAGDPGARRWQGQSRTLGDRGR